MSNRKEAPFSIIPQSPTLVFINLYLSNLDLQANEVYKIDPDFGVPGNAKNAIPQNANITGNAKNANPVILGNKDAGSLDNSGNAKNAHNLDLDLNLDTKDIDTLKGDSNPQSQSSSSQSQNPEYERMLLNNYAETKMSGERGVSFLGSKLLTFMFCKKDKKILLIVLVSLFSPLRAC